MIRVWLSSTDSIFEALSHTSAGTDTPTRTSMSSSSFIVKFDAPAAYKGSLGTDDTACS